MRSNIAELGVGSDVVAEPESIVNDESKLLEVFGVGDVTHQGDLIIVAIEQLPRSVKSRASRQLADGTTQGSRHVMTRGEVFDAPGHEVSDLVFAATGERVEAEFCGPVFVSPEDPTADDLQHPEHGNQGFPPRTICAVVVQRNLDSLEQQQRVVD